MVWYSEKRKLIEIHERLFIRYKKPLMNSCKIVESVAKPKKKLNEILLSTKIFLATKALFIKGSFFSFILNLCLYFTSVHFVIFVTFT